MAFERPHVTAERPLDAPLLRFDLPAMLARIKSEDTWLRDSHNAMTLAKSAGLRVVLVAMHGGARLQAHRTDGPISFQVLEGEVTFATDSQSLTLATGQLLTLRAGVRHAVEAPQECSFLLTLSTDAHHPAER